MKENIYRTYMLTHKQKELFVYLNNYISSNDISPSFEEMKNAVNLKSKSGIHRLITSLEQRGYIKRLKHKARAMEITKELKNNNNSIPGKKVLDNKKREILKIFNQAADKEESKTSIAEKVSSNLMVNTNRKLVRKVLAKEKSKSDINKKLIKKVY